MPRYVRHLRGQPLGDEMREWVLGRSEEGHGQFLNFLGGLHNERSTFEDAAYSLVGNRIEELMIETNWYNNFMKPDVSGRASSTWGDFFDRKEGISSLFKLKKRKLLGGMKKRYFGDYFSHNIVTVSCFKAWLSKMHIKSVKIGLPCEVFLILAIFLYIFQQQFLQHLIFLHDQFHPCLHILNLSQMVLMDLEIYAVAASIRHNSRNFQHLAAIHRHPITLLAW